MFILLLDQWNEASERRKFMEEYAKDNGLDPLNPDDWHSHPINKIASTKVNSLILYFILLFHFSNYY